MDTSLDAPHFISQSLVVHFAVILGCLLFQTSCILTQKTSVCYYVEVIGCCEMNMYDFVTANLSPLDRHIMTKDVNEVVAQVATLSLGQVHAM